MITPPPGVQVYLACGYTDMRKGMATLAMLVQQTLGHDPFSGAVYAFRGRRGGLIKVLWHDGVGMCLFIKRLERGQFVWPMSAVGDCVADAGAVVDIVGRLRVAGFGAQSAARAGGLILCLITPESLAATRRRASSSSRCADRSRGIA